MCYSFSNESFFFKHLFNKMNSCSLKYCIAFHSPSVLSFSPNVRTFFVVVFSPLQNYKIYTCWSLHKVHLSSTKWTPFYLQNYLF